MENDAFVESPKLPPKPSASSVPYLLRLLFGLQVPVKPLAYAIAGFGLMIFKYVAEATLIWQWTGRLMSPVDFVNPVLSVRSELLAQHEWLQLTIFAWSFVFLWIAVTMSVRRAADAGGSPWLGLLVLVPLVNLGFMVLMCFIPSSKRRGWMPLAKAPSSSDNLIRSAILAIAAGLLISLMMVGVSVYVLTDYGAILFLATPVVMGAVSAFLFNQPLPRSIVATLGVSVLSVVVAGMVLMLFALEGMICLFMAAPIAIPAALVGGGVGMAIACSAHAARRGMLSAIAGLPLAAAIPSSLFPLTTYQVQTSVDIDAPPAVVWENVVQFPELPEPTEWYFQMGIASPQRAHIVGSGVGAVRHCEFTTGSFVEPITRWEPPHHLAFDVTEQPAPMFELSPYKDVHPPHLHGFLVSERGAFELIELPGNRTRLVGRTWYQFRMFPQDYWTLWSDAVIHRIHLRVLRHIKRQSE